VKFENVFADYAKTWNKMKTDHKNLMDKAAERPLTSYQIGNVQYLLGTLQYDLGTFESHSGALDYNFARINEAIKSVRESQDHVRDSWQGLQQALSANSSGTPGAQFSDADIAAPIRAADERIQRASQAIKEASQRRAQYHSQAKDLYKKDETFVKSLKTVD
jgi:chromosome segregation ATPase